MTKTAARPASDPPARMERFVREQTASRLGRFAFEVSRALRSPEPDAIHDLRVSIRRLSQCLRLFRPFFPVRDVRRIRRRLRRIMSFAAEVRNRDVARELLEKAGAKARAALGLRLSQERKQSQRVLVAELRRLARRGFSSRWRTRLGL